jgi:hypothetical protein
MHWLMVAFLVSLCVLLLAAAGVARHIRLQHAKLRGAEPSRSAGSSEEADLESEP